MAKLIVKADESDALRQAGAEVQNIVTQIMRATPEQIEARIDTLTTVQLKKLLTVLVLMTRAQEKRLRELERRAHQEKGAP